MKENQMKMTMQSRRNYAEGEKDTSHSRARKRLQEDKHAQKTPRSRGRKEEMAHKGDAEEEETRRSDEIES